MLQTAAVQAGIVDGAWLSQFEEHVRASGSSERTIRAYGQDVRSFARWFRSVNGVELEPGLVTGVDLRAWRQHCLEVEKASPATWNRRRISMRVFTKWALGVGLVAYDPFQGVMAAEVVELAPRWLQPGDLAKIFRRLEQEINGARPGVWRQQAVRDQAMVALMALAGLREGEVVSLEVGDVFIGERSGKVVVRLGKGGKRREVPLNKEVRRALGMWLEVRGNDGPSALFTGCDSHGRVTTRTVQRRVAEAGRLAGVSLTPHDLRHTFAKRALDKGAPLTVVSRLLGHSRLETTARYVQPGWADFEQAVEAL